MKLVEILARELKEWPENINELTQSRFDNEVYINDEDGTSLQPNVFLSDHHNEGKCYPAVTRDQWEAERARIAAMEGISAFSQEQEISESQREKIAKEWWDKQMSSQPLMLSEVPMVSPKDYEQELWDKVSSSLFCKYVEHGCKEVDASNLAFSEADAFMAERAKRLKSSS